APSLVLVAVVFPGDRDGIERASVGGRVDLRVNDVGAGRRAGARNDRQQPWMVGREDRQLCNAAGLVETDIDRELVACLFAGADEARLADLPLQIDLEPVGGIVPPDIGVELSFRPLVERGA